MTKLLNALSIMKEVHYNQTDLCGEPYALHPIRVASRFFEENNEFLAICALLHDVLEDGADRIKLEERIKSEVSEEVLDLVLLLTRDFDESYENYIIRISKDDLAVKIKLSDLEDNMNLDRFCSLPEEDFMNNALRIRKYRKAKRFLIKEISLEEYMAN